MKKKIRNGLVLLPVLLFCVLTVVACSDSDKLPTTSASVTINYPDGVKDLKVTKEAFIFTNLTTGEKQVFNSSEGISLSDGLYDCAYKASVTYTNGEGGDAVTADGNINGKKENVTIKGGSAAVTIDTYLFAANDDFVFEEIFFSGTLRSSGSQYYGDGYFKIYNNTDHVLYADGLAFCESKFKSTLYFDYTPDIRKDTATVWSIYVIPGRGTDHPVQPGQSMTICDTGIDHRAANANSFNLSHADFEWYDQSTNPSFLDIDSPSVPNLDKWYCYTQTFYVLHNRGFSSYMLARIPVDKVKYLKDYWYSYNYVQHTQAGDFPMTQQAYKIPNSWIVDGVNCSVASNRVWNVLPPSIDAEWTHCGTIDHDVTRYFRSIRRKLLYVKDGIMKLKDTNNSSEDFNTECIPSIIEEQHTATNANGSTATVITYDGVQIKK